MDHAVNGAPLDHEMSTTNRGRIQPAERGNIIFPAEVDSMPAAGNSFTFGDDCEMDYGGGNPERSE